MSPRFAPDLSGTKAGLTIYDRGEYEVKITGVKPISYEKDDGTPVAGGQVNLEMVGLVQNDGSLDRELEGESVAPVRLYVHTEKSWPITKRFFMAALGYSVDEEEQFNEEVARELDISVEGDGDEAILGSGWERLVGKRLLVTLNKRIWQGREQQDHVNFMPLKS
jgi:hypothetical protein